VQSADIAMYVAKSEKKGSYRIYQELYGQNIRERMNAEYELRQAIAHDQLVVFYQPRADGVTGKFCGMEALVRWQHPERGLVPPNLFIPVAEQSGLIIQLGEIVIEKTCEQIAQWREAGLNSYSVSVNVSALQLKDKNLRHFLVDCMQRHGLTPCMLSIELTESTMLDEEGVASSELKRLRELGFHLLIDDFGTGQSSLSKLQSLEIDLIKIDQSFVVNLGEDVQSKALCSAVVSIGRALMSRPRLLLLDEPSMGLAPMFIQQIFNIIREIQSQGVSILLVEQNAAQALSCANRAYILETGNIVKEGAGKDLLNDDAIKKAYLGTGA
jgi:EAL domain-containing protein (putative c-di-GMP-specific phosphodiesterase class I)